MKIRSLKLSTYLRRATALIVMLAALTAPFSHAAAPLQGAYQVRDAGQDMTLEIATDEIWTRTLDRIEVRSTDTPGGLDNVVQWAESVRQGGQEADLVLYPADTPRDPYTRRYLTRHVLVQLDAGTDAQALAALVGASSAVAVSYAPGYWLFEIPNVGAALSAAEELRGQTGVLYAQAQFAKQAKKRFIPDDPLFPEQWHLRNVGQTGGTVGMDVNVVSVWDTFRGSGVVIGIVDDGLQISHPDLAPNAVSSLHWDWNGNDPDPSPDPNWDYHGTAVGGCAAARGHNTLGVSGSAPFAGLAGMRLIAGPISDAMIAESIRHEAQAIAVKNNSWGPSDIGFIVAGPGPLSAAALHDSTLNGRGGLGTIHLWAGGNGGTADHANYDGYANSIYTIAVGACNDLGRRVVYSESGACLVIVSPSLDFPSPPRPGIVTTDLVGDDGYNDGNTAGELSDGDYTRFFSGTSAASPIAAGVVALLLESNPNLGWRDVQELLIRSATFVDQQDAGWFVNAAGLRFNNKYGAGLINASNAVWMGQSWVNLPPQTNASVEATGLSLAIPDNNANGVTYDLPFIQGNMRVEHVTLTVNIQHARRGDLEIEVISPAGTRSVLAEPRPFDFFSNLNGWTFMSVQFWGENAFGNWKVTVRDRASGSVGSVTGLKLEFFGTPQVFNLPVVVTNYISGGNGNGIIDYNECNDFFIVLANLGETTSTHVQVSLSSPTPGVAFGMSSSPYLNIAPQTMATNLVPFAISTAPTFVCGTPIELRATVKSDQGTTEHRIVLETGSIGEPMRYDNNFVYLIPDNDPAGTNSPIVVSGFTSAVAKVTVALYINHTFDFDLQLQLISPEGITNMLAANRGGSGNNYGVGCQDNFRTTFDDEAPNSIVGSFPPFMGTFRPEERLAVFNGKSGTNVNGIWQLRVVDQFATDIGAIQCWSLFLTPSLCEDGGGQCPGVDMAIGMKGAPDPVFIGSNLVYTISITNQGPDTAKNVVMSQSLPGSVVFVGASASQGSISHAGGTVTANLGTMPALATASLTVTVLPTIPGVISSTATVVTSDTELNPANNTVTVTTRVNEPLSDLIVGMFAAPNPVLNGAPLTYTVSVTNKGPSTATGVRVTNTIPAGITVVSASASQGSVLVLGDTVVGSVGSLTNNGHFTLTINAIPSVEGTLTATAQVTGNQIDPLPLNNTTTASVIVGPAADLALTLTANPSTAVVNSNVIYTMTVSNSGPSIATGVVVNSALPPGVTVVSTTSTQGTFAQEGSSLVCTIGALAPGNGAVIHVVVQTANLGTMLVTATAAGAQPDTNPANNSASVSVFVAAPFVSIVAAGGTLTAESVVPANGAVDVGETVTIQLRLRNAGNVVNTNLIATLLPGGGVNSPSGAQTYGVLPPGGLPVARPFTFTASGTNGGTVVATLQLQDGANNFGTVSFNFVLPTVRQFANTNGIVIPDNGSASPYPSTIAVSGVSNLVSKVTATLANVTHTYPADVSVLLVGPAGQKVVLMSHAGAGGPLVNGTLTFDSGASTSLPQSGQLVSGTFLPTEYNPLEAFNAPAPARPYGNSLSVFNGGNVNGTWSLYVLDDATGDAGNIAQGWSLAITTTTPVNQIADLGIVGTSAPAGALVGQNITYTFTITNSGPNQATSVAVTNTLPAAVSLVSATASQGHTVLNGNAMLANLGDLASGASATVTVTGTLQQPGSITNRAGVYASENDLNPANNIASVVSAISLPVADLALAASAAPAPGVVGSNLTYTVTVTNLGPQTALNVQVTTPLPEGLVFDSVTSSSGTSTNTGAAVITSVGNLASGATAAVAVNVIGTNAVTITNTLLAATFSNDGNPENNSATLITDIANPAPRIVAAGARLVSESLSPADGTVSTGETVTVALSLANDGSDDAVNVTATLLASGGVSNPGAAQNYGALVRGAPPITRNFSFTGGAGADGVITATLALQDGPNSLGTVTFQFKLPDVTSFANSAAITIPEMGSALPYPSIINVSGVTGLVSKVTVTLNNINHRFPSDINVLLVSPAGRGVVLMSHAGGGHSLTNVTVSFDDGAGLQMPHSSRINPVTYRPTVFAPAANFPPSAPAAPYGATLGSLNGIDPNGEWKLFVVDDSSGDGGDILNGWSLNITTVNPVNPASDLALTMTAAPNVLFAGSLLTYSIAVVNNGPDDASDVIVKDTLPSGTVLHSALLSQGDYSETNGLVTINLGTLVAGAAASVTLQVIPSTAGVVVNSAAVGSSGIDLNPADNSAQAAAMVMQLISARLSGLGVLTNGQFQFTLEGQPGLTYVIQASADLLNWTPVSTNTAVEDGTFKFTDPEAPEFMQRFYRAVRVP